MTWFPRLRGRIPAAPATPMERARAPAEAGDHGDDLAIWEFLARGGDARACNSIGACFAEGRGVPCDRFLAAARQALDADGIAAAKRRAAA